LDHGFDRLLNTALDRPCATPKRAPSGRDMPWISVTDDDENATPA
jgi:hypothetical protein